MKINSRKIISTASIAFCLTFVLATGPQVQLYLLSLLNSSAPSIYGSAYKEALIDFPTLGEWLGTSFVWQFPVMGILISSVVWQGRKPRYILWKGTMVSIVVLSLMDIGFGWWGNQLNLKWIAECATSNLVGGTFLGALLVVLLLCADFLYNYIPSTEHVKNISVGLASILVGVFINCFIYYCFSFLYAPIPVKFDAYFSPPASFHLTEKGWKEGEISKSKLLPEQDIVAEAHWTGMSKELRLGLKNVANKVKYRVELDILEGCASLESARKAKGKHSIVIAQDVDSMRLSVNDGLSWVYTDKMDDGKSEYKIQGSALLPLNVTEDGESKRLEISQFSSKPAKLEVLRNEDFGFLILTPLIDSKDDKTFMKARLVSIETNSRKFSINFMPPKKVEKNAKISCEGVNTVLGGSGQVDQYVVVNGGQVVGGVAIRLIREDDGFFAGGERPSVVLEGDGGWLGFKGIDSSDLKNHEIGQMEMFQIQGNSVDMVLDATSSSIRTGERITAIGDLKADFNENGRIHVTGNALRLWKDEGRLNPTKWEKLGWEAKLFLVGLIGSVGLLFGKLLTACLIGNKRFQWIS